MTNEFAIKDLEGLKMFEHREEFIHTMDVEAINLAVEALEKQIPKTPMYKMVYGKRLTSEAYCIECGNTVFRNDEYCSKCGQAVDWSEVDNVSRS